MSAPSHTQQQLHRSAGPGARSSERSQHLSTRPEDRSSTYLAAAMSAGDDNSTKTTPARTASSASSGTLACSGGEHSWLAGRHATAARIAVQRASGLFEARSRAAARAQSSPLLHRWRAQRRSRCWQPMRPRPRRRGRTQTCLQRTSARAFRGAACPRDDNALHGFRARHQGFSERRTWEAARRYGRGDVSQRVDQAKTVGRRG